VALLVIIDWMVNFGVRGLFYYLKFLVGSVEMEPISFHVVLAAMTRSAQIPFFSCSPAAMANLIPVSAFIYFSTLFTAGVCWLIRFSPSFN
jgi:NADH:ubiquinone oxidoreductase subunit 5 (subunit L)/multisubunit Na+/H+ antiporter MnhA subunit